MKFTVHINVANLLLDGSFLNKVVGLLPGDGDHVAGLAPEENTKLQVCMPEHLWPEGGGYELSSVGRILKF